MLFRDVGLNEGARAEMIGINRGQVEKIENENAAVIRRLNQCGDHLETKFEQDIAVVYAYSNFDAGKRYELDEMDVEESELDEDSGENSELDEDSELEEDEALEAVDEYVVDDDFEEDVPVEELGSGKLTRCIVYAAGYVDTRKNRIGNVANVSISSLDCESTDEDPLKCSICSKTFSTTANRSQHNRKGAVGKKDMLSCAILYARDVVDQHEFEIVNSTTDVSSLQILAPVREIPHANVLFQPGWAKTRSHGKKYGRKYIQAFKQDVVDMFNAGKDDSAKKKGPGRMLAELRRRYPLRLDLPSESEIRACISTLMAKQKKGQDTVLTSKRGIPEPYLSSVLEIFQDTPDIAPRVSWKKFQALHPLLKLHLPHILKVKSKISSLKSQLKKRS